MPTQIITPKWILPIDDARQCLENHSIVIKDHVISDILPTEEALKQHPNIDQLILSDHAIMPGFVNTHGHAAMTLFRGMADDLPLMTWLNDHIWPAEAKFVTPEFVYDGTKIAIGEMLLSGTTTFSDNYFFPEQCAKAVLETGIRAQINAPIIDFPTPWSKDGMDAINKTKPLFEQYKNNDFVYMAWGPHAPYTVSDETLTAIKEIALPNNHPIQMHVHETQGEVDESIKKIGLSPIERIQKLGLLNEQFQAVHMTALSKNDKQIIKETGTHVMHCPQSNLKLASGMCEVGSLQSLGVNVALGTDGAASNNDLDMLDEMRTAAMLAKAVAKDPQALPAKEALAMATINGAKALGIENKLGSLEKGKFADMIAINLNHISCQPIFDVHAQIAYAATRSQISHVWVHGKPLVTDHKLNELSHSQLITTAQKWQQKIQNN